MRIRNRKYVSGFLAAGPVVLLAPFAWGQQEYIITADTLIDSGSPGTFNPATGTTNDPGTLVNGQDIYSYGADGKVKAVTSSYSSTYPYVSATHVLFDLPQSFWTAIGTQDVASVVVSYYPFNDSLSPADAHDNLELHPLTQSFTVGNGTQSPLVPSTDGGATWDSYDGTVADAWATPGGDYDAANYALASVTDATLPPSKGSTPFSWNITSLINNPTTRAELEDNGALIKVINEGIFPNNPPPPSGENDFVSFYSADYMTAMGTSNPAFLPNVMVTMLPQPTQWANGGGGDWNVTGNWNNGVPNGLGAEADLDNSPSTIFTNASVTLSTLHINSAASYLINGSGDLTFVPVPSTSALIQVDAGSHELNLPVTISGNTNLTVAPGASLTFANPVTITTGTVTPTSTGTITYQSNVTVEAGASLTFANSTSAHSLSIQSGAVQVASSTAGSPTVLAFTGILLAGNGAMDITNNEVIDNYTGPDFDQVSNIAAAIASGAHNVAGNDTWTGSGIFSSTAATSNSKFAVGYLDGDTDATALSQGDVQANQIIVKYVLTGDAYLENSVGFGDLLVVAQHYGQGGWDWAGGNFNYDPAGSVGFSDLLSVAQNYGQSYGSSDGVVAGNILPLAWGSSIGTSAVPEPTSVALAALAAGGLLARRRKIARSSQAS